jgi:predicted HTH transcriptional regulator
MNDFIDGLSLKSFLTLPPEHQEIINWIRQQGKCSLEELSVHFCHDEETIFRKLVPLVRQGYLLPRQGENTLYYQVQFPPKRPKKIPLKMSKFIKENPVQDI